MMRRPDQDLLRPAQAATPRRSLLVRLGGWLLLSSAPLVTRLASAKSSTAYRMGGLLDLNGAKTSLSAQANGQLLVVVVMKGHWCDVCVQQLRRFAALGIQLKRLNAKVVGLNADTVRANRKVAEEKQVNLPILSDSNHRIIDALGLWLPEYGHPMPSLVVFDQCGKEVARKVGRRPGTHPEAAVMTLLRRLSEEKPSCEPPNA